MARTGAGTTIAFATSGFTARFRQLTGHSEEIPVLDDTILASTNYMEKVPGDLKDMDAFEGEFYFDPDATLPPLGTVETITLTYPVQPAKTTGARLVASGFVNRFDRPTLTPTERLVATVSIQFDGKTEPAVTPGA